MKTRLRGLLLTEVAVLFVLGFSFLILYLYNPTASKARYIETPTIVEPAPPDPEPAVVDEQAPEETYYEEQWDESEDNYFYEELNYEVYIPPSSVEVYEASWGPVPEEGYYGDGSGVLTMEGGVNYYNGRRETWYSQRVLPGGGLDIPGRHVADDGTIRDEDGLICVAASDLEYGTLVETSLGLGKVYDCGCPDGTTDIYVDW